MAALAAAGVAVVAGGCGGGSKSPSVASLAPSGNGTTTQRAPAEPAPESSGGGGGGAVGIAIKVPNGAKFSACMRAHGLPNFPDPNGQGVIQAGAGDGIDPRSPKFRAAQQACGKALPNGGRPSPQQLAKAQQAALAFSACMRSHGVKDFPDPTFSGGGVTLRLRSGPGSDLDPRSSFFQKAQTACQGKLPGKFGAGPGGK
jgi:hypothetical protein